MKKMIKIAFVAAFAAIAGYGVYANQKSEVLSDLTLANVEALADINETDSSGQTLYCCGNEDTCAKGEDEDTGEEFIIHGVLSSKKCK